MPRAAGDLPPLARPHQRSVCPAASLRPRFTFPMPIISQICFPAAPLMVILVKALSPGCRGAPCPSECDQASIAASFGERLQMPWFGWTGQLCC